MRNKLESVKRLLKWREKMKEGYLNKLERIV